MAVPCPTCIPVDCSDTSDTDLYSIESPIFPFILNCPPGFDCGANAFEMVCCGQLLSVQIPVSATVDERATLIQGVLNQCGVRQLYCGDLPQLPPGTPVQLYYNVPKQCTVVCPDGSPFVYTVAPGVFLAATQAEADANAASFACVQAALRRVCLGSIPSCPCVGVAYSATIATSGGIAPFSWGISSGFLPPGLILDAFGVLSGTPTTPGVYSFTVKVTEPDGSNVTKNFRVTCLKITTTTIDGFTVGVPYSFQLVATGGSGNYVWSVSGGNLPDGLVMSASGLITGTPTSSLSATLDFKVADASCEAASPIPTPAVLLRGRSVTKIATILGWAELPGFASTPPKRYKTVTWAGSSEQQLWYLGVQIGGAKFDFGGADTIDSQGNVLTRHTKATSVMCNGANNRAIVVGPTYPQNTIYSQAASFLGYFGTNTTFYPNLLGPTELCVSGSIPYQSLGDQAANSPFDYTPIDLFGLWGSGGTFDGKAIVTFSSATLGASTDTGTANITICPYIPPLLPNNLILESFSSLQTPSGVAPRPPDWGASATVIFTNDFSAILTDEYTDAEALTVARTVNGNGLVAQNFPRTTGYVSNFTNVTYTLSCANLVSGQSYTVAVDLADLTNGTIVTKTYNITATAITQTITDTIPTPTAGHTVVARNARIFVAP